MKRNLLLAISFFLAMNSFAQVNSYLQNNPQWLVYNQWSQAYPCISNDSTNYYLNGDSIINSLTYKKLYAKGHVIDQWWSSNPNMGCYGNYTYADTVPTGFLRSQGLQMYYIMFGDTAEYLLYDFNLTVGSQLPLTYTYSSVGTYVTSIDSFYTPYGYRKRFYIDNNSNTYLIEGVGSNYGLIEPFGVMMDAMHTFLCYGMNDTAWIPQQGPACNVITTTPVSTQQEFTLELIPNPASEYVEISADGIFVESITVYDVFGRAVKQQTDTKLFVSDLPPGIYTCVCVTGEMRINKILIVE